MGCHSNENGNTLFGKCNYSIGTVDFNVVPDLQESGVKVALLLVKIGHVTVLSTNRLANKPAPDILHFSFTK